jgi:chromate transporter
MEPAPRGRPVGLGEVARRWLRIGGTSFGGPSAQVHLLRQLCVEAEGWLSPEEFEHALGTTNLLPGPAGTQMALYCAWRVGGLPGMLVGGVAFVLPGLVTIVALGAAVLAIGAPRGLVGASLGASAVVPAIALRAGIDLLRPSRRGAASRWRWLGYVLAGGLGTLLLGPLLVLVLLSCGLVEVLAERIALDPPRSARSILLGMGGLGALGPLAWTSLKVGGLSFGGGFVIIPLIEADAVSRHHWMTRPAFLAAVALGQITPGPVVQTVAVVGWAAAGLGGALLAALVTFLPSFLIVGAGARHFERLRRSAVATAFLRGAGPAAIGAILGVVPLLARGVAHLWQVPLALGALVAIVGLRRSAVVTIAAGGLLGLLAGLCGLPATL